MGITPWTMSNLLRYPVNNNIDVDGLLKQHERMVH